MTVNPQSAEFSPAPPVTADERLADVLGPSATVDHPDLGPGLRAIRRSGPEAQALYVVNPTDVPQSFSPAQAFGSSAAPRFLGGEVETLGETGPGLVCRLGPQSHVWLVITNARNEEAT